MSLLKRHDFAFGQVRIGPSDGADCPFAAKRIQHSNRLVWQVVLAL